MKITYKTGNITASQSDYRLQRAGEAIFSEKVIDVNHPGEDSEAIEMKTHLDPDSNHRLTIYKLANGQTIITG